MMDNTDKQILRILSENADTTATDIGASVGLSVPAVNKRIARMRSLGIIRKSTVLTDPKLVGKSVVAFILLVMRYGEGVVELMSYIDSDPDVLECCAVTGEYDYLIKICAESVEQLEKKLLSLKRQKGVVKSHTMLSLAEHKLSPTPLPTEFDYDAKD